MKTKYFHLVSVVFLVNGCSNMALEIVGRLTLETIGYGIGKAADKSVSNVLGLNSKKSNTPEKITLIKESNGDWVYLRKFHIEGDTLLGTTVDYVEVKIPTEKIIGAKLETFKNENEKLSQ